jgi:hypothetical protein
MSGHLRTFERGQFRLANSNAPIVAAASARANPASPRASVATPMPNRKAGRETHTTGLSSGI